MPGSTLDALRLIELASTRLCDAAAGSDGAPRLTLWRAAWSPAGDAVSWDQILGMAGCLPENIRLDTAHVQPGAPSGGEIPQGKGRIICNLLLLAAEALPGGGVIALAGSGDDLFVRVSGPRAAWPAGLAVWFNDEAAAHEALFSEQSLQGALTALLARAAGLRLSMVLPPTGGDVAPILRLSG